MKILFSLLFLFVMIIAQSGNVFASDLPVFTSCVNPQGQIKANYESGTHGIAGKTGTYQGKDTVYSISENGLTQCFCPSDGSGIQTNWLKASNLSESQIKIMVSQGWIYIPNGALWGLDQSPYLAFNSDFSCKSGENGGSGGSSGSSSSSSDNSGSGAVLGSSSGGIGQILGLASTGNMIFLLAVLIISFISLNAGLFLKKRSKKLSK